MIIYTPIYLSSYLGFSWKEIGLLFSIMLLPFLFIPILAGKYADKIGERNMLMLGFGIASIATVSLFVVGKPIFWIWALLLFGTRVGISMSESMSDTYFFKHIKPENEEFVGVYRSAPPTAEILGPVVAFLLISILPSFSFIFLILGIFLLTGTFLASRIRRSDI
jgi:MFS family permease